MKIRILFGLALLSSLIACETYEPFLDESVGFSVVYFPTDEFVEGRAIVSDEGMSIKIGALLGGLRNNDADRIVEFAVADTLLDGTTYEPLPSNYYTLSNDKRIIIPKGQFRGFIDVSFDSTLVAEDNKFDSLQYAIPLVITGTSVDSVLEGLGSVIIPLRLMNTHEGNFYNFGLVNEILLIKPVLINSFTYGDSINGPRRKNKELGTISSDSVLVKGIGNVDGVDMVLKVNDDNSVIVSSGANNVVIDAETMDTVAVYNVEPNGDSRWDPVKRRFFLKYKYELDGSRFEIEEVLTFRNRIRDGINEWRWKGFPGN